MRYQIILEQELYDFLTIRIEKLIEQSSDIDEIRHLVSILEIFENYIEVKEDSKHDHE